jgi:hypothetical protein
MVQWEYQVIRLNVEPPVAAPPPVAPPAPATKPGFSEAYLREEFPRYYDNPPAQAQPQSEDPGAQLQTFLNGHGQQGWELVGFQHAAPHVFIVFKRPAGSSDSAQAALAAQQEQLRLTLDLANRALAIIEKQAG